MATIDCALDDPDLERQVLEMEAAPTLPPMLRQAPANQQIEAMLQQGYSYRQIERTLNVSHATIAQVRRSLRSAALQSAIFDDEKDDSFIEAT
jgi:DNA-binding NarL/FixJ family response regulator